MLSKANQNYKISYRKKQLAIGEEKVNKIRLLKIKADRNRIRHTRYNIAGTGSVELELVA